MRTITQRLKSSLNRNVFLKTTFFLVLISLSSYLPVFAARGSETSLEEIAGYVQEDQQKSFEANLIAALGQAIGCQFKSTNKIEPMAKKTYKTGPYNTMVVGIPFSINSQASKSTYFPELEDLNVSCRVLYDTPDGLNQDNYVSRLEKFPDQFANLSEILAGKSEKIELTRKKRFNSLEISAIEISGIPLEAGEEPPANLKGGKTPDSGDGMFIGGVDITGSDATVSSNGKTGSKGKGFLKGVGEFFKQNSDSNGTKQPSGPQPESGTIVETGTNLVSADSKSVLRTELRVSFATGLSPHARIECRAKFKMTGDKNDSKFLPSTITALDEFANMFIDFAQTACIKAQISKDKIPATKNSDPQDKVTDITLNKEKGPEDSNGNDKDPTKTEIPLTERAKKIIEIQSKLAKLVPEYIPDDPTQSDSATLEKIEELLEGKSSSALKQEAKLLEENTISSADGSGLGISKIITPADESVGPGENFTLKIKIVNRGDSPNSAAFTLYALDPWTGKELARSIQKAARGDNQVEFPIKAPPAGEATKNLEIEILLEPMIGTGPVPKRVKFALRGSISDSDILNQVRRKIFEVCSETRQENDGVSDSEQDGLFNQWQKRFWKNAPEQTAFKKLFSSDPSAALEQVIDFARPRAWKIVQGKQEAREEKSDKETESMEKLHRQIMYWHLETATHKRNAVIDYRIDPGYDLLDVLKDNIEFDEKTGEVIGDLNAARGAITEANWELMQKTMSAADKYYLTAGDDGLPEITGGMDPAWTKSINDWKSNVEILQKTCEAIDFIKEGEKTFNFSAESMYKVANLLKKTAGIVKNTQQLVGDAAKPLAEALSEYQGMFRKMANASGKTKADINLAEMPNLLGEAAKSMKTFGSRINNALEAYEKAIAALPETGKFATVIKSWKSGVNSLRKIVASSFSIGNSMISGMVKFTDGIIEVSSIGAGKTLGKVIDTSSEVADVIDGKTLATSNKIAEGADLKAKTIEKIPGLGSRIVKHVGNGLDMLGVVTDANVYMNSGQTPTEAYSRALVSGGIEKVVGSKINPVGLINFGMVKIGEKLAESKSIDEAMRKRFNISPKQINLSVPAKVIANNTVNFVKDYYDSEMAPGERAKMAAVNKDKISELTILANRCLEMAKKSTDPAIQQDYIRKRKLFREQIRTLGGVTEK